MSLASKHPSASKIASKGVRKCVNNGSSCLFWHDSWLGAGPLKEACSRLFLLAISPHATVEQLGFWEGLNWIWTFTWKRGLRPRDMEEKRHLDALLQQVCLAYDSDDKLSWAFSSSGNFSSKSFNLELDKLNPVPHHDAIKGVWKGLVPHRIEIFVWTALLEKINTRQKLAKIGIIPPENNSCPMCSNAPESSNHLLLHCPFAQQLWWWWNELWGVMWVFPSSLKKAFEQWRSQKGGPFFKKVWLASFFIIVWSIWKERNSRIFENTSNSPKSIQDMILLRLGWWIKGWCDEFPYSPIDIQRNPQCLLWNGSKPLSLTLQLTPSCEWSPPEIHCYKWNVDASVNVMHKSSAIGGVLRNHLGNFKCLFSSPIPFMEINCAEVLAIHRAIKISITCEFTKNSKLLLESDSFNAVLWCTNDYGGPWNMRYHLNFIRNALKKDLHIQIIHKSGRSNFVADSLAKQGLTRLDEFIAWL